MGLLCSGHVARIKVKRKYTEFFKIENIHLENQEDGLR